MAEKRWLSALLLMVAAIINFSSCAVMNDERMTSTKAPTMTTEIDSTVKVQRLDPRLDKLVPAGAQFEKLAAGYNWVEGPVWQRQENYLLFSDIPSNSIYKWKTGEGVKLFMKPSGYTGQAPFEGREPGTNGLTFDSNGRLV